MKPYGVQNTLKLCKVMYLLLARQGVNFINVLLASFTGADPKSTKKDSQAVSLFCAFGI